jgi:hypothetical protein
VSDEARYRPTDEVSVTRVVVDEAHLRRLDLKPDEVLICTAPDGYAAQDIGDLQDALVMCLGGCGVDNPTLVIPHDLDLSAITLTDQHLDSIAGQVADRLRAGKCIAPGRQAIDCVPWRLADDDE